MPSLSLLTTSPPLLSAALAAASPQVSQAPAVSDPGIFGVTPLTWSLAAPQQTPPPAGTGPEDAEPIPQEPIPQREEAGEEPSNEIIIEGSYGPPAGDPAEQFNAESYRITQAVDQALVEPVAYAYRDGLPEPIRDGLGNVVRNLGEPSNALNFLLQGKVGKAFETLGRLAINSTLGVGGLIDIAGKPGIGLPYRRNGFANTMGFYGAGPGAYLYLPVTGATTVRDLLGSTLDQALLPFAIGKPFDQPEYAVTYFLVNGLDQRLAFDEELAEIEASDDPYGMRRDTYLEQRRRDIAALKGEVIEDEVPAPDDAMPEEDLPPQTNLSLAERLQITASQAPDGR